MSKFSTYILGSHQLLRKVGEIRTQFRIQILKDVIRGHCLFFLHVPWTITLLIYG